jgi:endoglucanase
MLRTSGTNIVDRNGKKLVLKSIGIGGWLMMEGYMLGGKNIPEHVFKTKISKLYGKNKVKEFTDNFQKHFFNESDVKKIKLLGFNCARLPINYRILGDLKLLDKAVSWFRKYKIYLILDLHAAPGSQNYDWHSDSDGVARLWDDNKYHKQTVAIWDRLSRRYKNEEYIAGYDILNEPVTKKTDKVNRLYSAIIKTIRNNGDKHIIFVEPNMWAQSFKGIKTPKDNNFVWSIHYYHPIDYTFNWNPMMEHPGISYIKKELSNYRKKQKKDHVPIFVGEFGVASRCPVCNSELKWVKDCLNLFKQYGWSWSYWTYKSVAGALVPDGLYRIFDHEMFRRESNEPGMENIVKLLKDPAKRLFYAIETRNFSLHKELFKVLSRSL